MPTFTIFVTTLKEEIPENFLLDASKFISQELGKPEEYVTTRVVPGQMMCHGGTMDPCGSLHVTSIGALGEKNKQHAKAIGDFIEQKLGISKNRFYINFYDIPRPDCGYNGTTF